MWLTTAGLVLHGVDEAILLGDANLDGIVDGLDFLEWNANRFTNTPAWCAGDFNADGIVDGNDFLLWNANRFQSILDIPPSSVAVSPGDVKANLMLQIMPVTADHTAAREGLFAELAAWRRDELSWFNADRTIQRNAGPALTVPFNQP